LNEQLILLLSGLHHYRIKDLCRVSTTLGKALKTLGKGFAGVTPGKGQSVVIIPAKTSLLSAFCRALGKGFAQCQIRHSAKKSRRDGVWDRDGSLPSALGLTLGKV
jgi:hypothetical protein